MAKEDVKITYNASELIAKIYTRIENLNDTQISFMAETKNSVSNVSDRVTELNERFEKAVISISGTMKTNLDRMDLHEQQVNEKVNRHDMEIGEAKATMRTLRHVMGWVGAVISVMAGVIGWSVDNFLKNKVTTISNTVLDERVEKKVNDLLESYNLEIKYE